MKRLVGWVRCRLGSHWWVPCYGFDFAGESCWYCGRERAS